MDVVKAANSKFNRWLNENTGMFAPGRTGYGEYDRAVLDMPNYLENPDDERIDYGKFFIGN